MTDIARQARVSQSSVSFVLNGGERGKKVSEKTAERIRRIAQKLKYHPNHAARQLAGKRSGVLGALASTWFHYPVRPRFLSFLHHHANMRGQKILAWQTDLQTKPIEQFVQEFGGRGIDGLIYLAFDNEAEWPAIAPLLAQLPNVVSLMSDAGIAGSSCVLSDVADGVRQQVEHLHRQGRRKIVQILEGLDTSLNRQRHEGFCRAHEHLGRPLEPEQLCLATRDWGEADFPKYVELAEDIVRRPRSDGICADAILADNDLGAARLLWALADLGLRVPDDVAVIGWGNEVLSRYTTPRLTTVEYCPAKIFEAALDILAAPIESPETAEPRTVTIKPELMVWKSG